MNEQQAISAYIKRHGLTGFNPIAALIDMDGTLYDSMGHHADAWYHMATDADIECTRDEFFLYEGRTGASTLNILFNRAYGRDATPEEIKHLYSIKARNFNEMPAVDPMPGAGLMIDTFHEYGLATLLVTGSGQNTLLNRLDTDYPGAFPATLRVTSFDVTHGKPHPEPFLKAMSLINASPSQCIAVDNAPLGVQSGAASGAFTVGVTTGPIPTAELYRAGADIVYTSMPEMGRHLPHLMAAISQYRN